MGRDCLAFRVRRASRIVSRAYDRRLADVGLTSTQLTVLTAIANRPDLKMAELADELGFEASTLSRAVSLLVRHKWVRAAAGTNRRDRFLELTPRGREKMRSAYSAWSAAQADVKHALSAAQLPALLAALSSLRSLQLHE